MSSSDASGSLGSEDASSSDRPERLSRQDMQGPSPAVNVAACSRSTSVSSIIRGSSRRRSSSMSGNGSKSGETAKIGRIGVCAMDAKAGSKPCKHILNTLIEQGEFETVIFGDKVILDESIENWPTCDFLISFFSTGFPLQKAIDYVNLRKPYLVNDLELQKVLWDRRLVLTLLQVAGVPTPPRLVVSRDGGPRVDARMKAKLAKHGVDLKPVEKSKIIMEEDDEVLRLEDGSSIRKPFVEKPVDGENHNVFVYYSKKDGGGGRRLFRKVGNKSSEFDPQLRTPRSKGSYIYEKFMDTDNLEDVKAYTVGPNYCHAETRKSPVVDGVVRRNTYGKEIRFVTKLTPKERAMASAVSLAFEQCICGFDLLRVHGESYVIDVNGFSFVKDNKDYYDNCARILREIFINARKDRISRAAVGVQPALPVVQQQKWICKGQVYVIRHADRTPKQKFKFSFKSHYFIGLLQGHKEEVIIRDQQDLANVLEATKLALHNKTEDIAKLHQLKLALEKKTGLPGTKVQIKPVLSKDVKQDVEKVQLIVKWGGEPTHSARYQALDLGVQMRQEMQLLNRDAMDNVQIFTSSERRVMASANLWASSFLDLGDLPDDFLNVRKDLLDDSNAAKDIMDQIKKRLKPLLRQGSDPPPQFTWPPKFPQPFDVLTRVVELMTYHHRIMEFNFTHKDFTKFQSRWCSGEDPLLFKERWDKLFAEFVTVEKVDPSKISELYDTMKYDALHNRSFLEQIFRPDSSIEELAPSKVAIPSLKQPSDGPFNGRSRSTTPTASSSLTSSFLSLGSSISLPKQRSATTRFDNGYHGVASSRSASPISPHTLDGKFPAHTDKQPPRDVRIFETATYAHLRELYRLSKILFDFICPQEYGIEDDEKLDIGLLTSLPLVKTIVADLERLKNMENGAIVTYFTKESHIYTLLNIIYESQIPMKLARNVLPELDYLTQIAFEIYEATDAVKQTTKADSDQGNWGDKRYSIRLSISPGCNTQDPLDVQLDSKHCISCIPRVALTRHLDAELVLSRIRARFHRVSLPKKFIPVNISSDSLKFRADQDARARNLKNGLSQKKDDAQED